MVRTLVCGAFAAAATSLLLGGAANAGTSVADALLGGNPIVDLRARYEGVGDKSKTLFANAVTFRARLGYETTAWEGLSLAVDFDVVAAAMSDYNSTRNGKTVYPTVSDPALATLNRLQLSYTSLFDTKIVVGRQRLQLGDQRFIGNSAWRQHEQTFDALTLVNTSVKDLTLTYSYLERVNRVYGPNDPTPATGQAGHYSSDSHLFNAVYSGVKGLKLEGYVYLLDLSQTGPIASVLATSRISTATFGARGEYKTALSDDLTGQLNVAFAHQSNYASNPLSFGLNYWALEGSLSYCGLSATIGNEVMGGNGTIGFSTPLASLHPFDGLANMFLTTPANGIDDFYLKGGYALPGVLLMKSMTFSLAYHDFTTDKLGSGIGDEWDGSLELAVNRTVSFFLGAADYQGAEIGLGGFKGKSIYWLQAVYKY